MGAEASIAVRGIPKARMAQLTSKAKQLRMTPERYVRKLIEADLTADLLVRHQTIAEIMGPGQAVDEAELDRLVEEVREDLYRRRSKRRARA